jgi:hypothetical protein
MGSLLVPNAQQEGMVELGTYSFTSVQTATLPYKIFSTAFDNYQININYAQNTTAGGIYFYFVTNESNVATDFYQGGQGWSSAGAAINRATANGTVATITGATAAKADAGLNSAIIKIFNPLTTGRKNFMWQNTYWNSSDVQNALFGGGFCSNGNICDGLKFETSAGTMTGTWSVYGMRK